MRHRFVGEVGQLCGWSGGGTVCALSYASSLHYNDDDHPFDPGEPAGASCGWQKQNVWDNAEGNLFCWGMAEDPRHHRDEVVDPEVTVTMQYPVAEAKMLTPAEMAYPDGRVYGRNADAPGEDNQFKHNLTDGTHNLFRCRHPACVRDAAAAREQGLATEEPPEDADKPEVRAAWALEHGDVVTWGPWPVRQFHYGPGELGLALFETTEALRALGEPYTVEVWWAAPESMLALVTWGSLAGLDDTAVVTAVAAWVLT